jgi:2-oxoglutarate dehydrogenase E1 component
MYLNQFKACSNLDEFSEGNIFKRVIGETMPDTLVIPEQIKTVVLCSGQFYYDIVERRSKEGIKVFFKLRIWL